MFKLTMKIPEWCYELVNTLWVSARKHKKLSSSTYISSEPLIELHFFGLETWQSHYICYRTLMIIPQCAALWTLLAPLADETNSKDWMSTKTTLLVLTKMPRSRNQVRVKCEPSFAEWVNQPGVRTSKRGQGSKALKAYIIWALVLYWKILFREQIHSYSKAFLFNKLTYKTPSYASTPCIIRPSSFQLNS